MKYTRVHQCFAQITFLKMYKIYWLLFTFFFSCILSLPCFSNPSTLEKEFTGPYTSVSIGYATPTDKSIASSFGHSFLVLYNESISLSADVANFAAVDSPDNFFDKVSSGFSSVLDIRVKKYSLHEHISHYSNTQSRDIYLYEMSASQQEIALLVNYLNTFNSQHNKYHYTHANCSSYILDALTYSNIAPPLKNAITQINTPQQLIRYTKESSIVSSTYNIKSILHKMQAYYLSLEPAAKRNFLAHAENIKAQQVSAINPASTGEIEALFYYFKLNKINYEYTPSTYKDIMQKFAAKKTTSVIEPLNTSAIDPSLTTPLHSVSFQNQFGQYNSTSIGYAMGQDQYTPKRHLQLGNANIPFAFQYQRDNTIPKDIFSLQFLNVVRREDFNFITLKPSWAVLLGSDYTSQQDNTIFNAFIDFDFGLSYFGLYNKYYLFAGAAGNCSFNTSNCAINPTLEAAYRFNPSHSFNIELNAGQNNLVSAHISSFITNRLSLQYGLSHNTTINTQLYVGAAYFFD